MAVEPLDFAGQQYAVAGRRAPAILDVAHTTTGYSLRLRYEARLDGPACAASESAGRTVRVDAREVDQPGGGDELDSPYLEEEQLDLKAWARDAGAGAAAVPDRLPGRVQGALLDLRENLNTAGPEHRHEREPDRAGLRSES